MHQRNLTANMQKQGGKSMHLGFAPSSSNFFALSCFLLGSYLFIFFSIFFLFITRRLTETVHHLFDK